MKQKPREEAHQDADKKLLKTKSHLPYSIVCSDCIALPIGGICEVTYVKNLSSLCV